MRNLRFTLLAVCCLATAANAQIGGGILNKAKKAAEQPANNNNNKSKPAEQSTTPANSNTTKPASTSGSTTGGSKATTTKGKSSATNPWGTGSPASYEIGVLKSTMDELKQRHGSAWFSGKIDGDFEKARGYIAKIKTKDPEWDITPEEKLVEEYWTIYKNLEGDLKKEEDFEYILKNVNDAIRDNEAIGAAGDYAGFIGYRDTYLKKYPAKKEAIETADKYFNELLPQYLDGLLSSLKDEMPRFDNDDAKMNPTQAIYTLKGQIEKLADAVKAVKTGTAQETEVKKQHAAFIAEKEKFEKFISSGEFETFKKTKAAEILAKKRFPKTFAANAALEPGAKTAITNYYSSDKITFLRSGMEESEWKIFTYTMGSINYRQRVAVIAYKRESDGKCYIARVYIKEKQSYGKWTGVPIYQYTGDAWEILCDNVAK